MDEEFPAELVGLRCIRTKEELHELPVGTKLACREDPYADTDRCGPIAAYFTKTDQPGKWMRDDGVLCPELGLEHDCLGWLYVVPSTAKEEVEVPQTTGDPAPCKLYHVNFEALFEITVAAPVDMPEADVRALIEKRKAWIIDQEVGVFEWHSSIPFPDDGDASDTDRDTYIVDDKRTDLVVGEETKWLPEDPK